MRAELPWNVAGIPPEAREAARAAARREGLSVGEWLTLHIMRSFSGPEEELSGAKSGSAAMPLDSWGPPPSRARESDEMPARRGEIESGDSWRRIEEQLRGIGRRLESNERSHSESNRFLSHTAQEMNANAREQAQVFEQLSQTVLGLRERLERLERSVPGDNIREAIKALHLGLSRLADQLTSNAGNSAGQLAQVTANLEKLAVHVGKVWEDADNSAQLLNRRIDLAQAEFAQRLEDKGHSLGARLSAAEKTTKFNTIALDHALEKIETAANERAAELAEGRQRALRQEENLGQLKDSLTELEARLPGIKLEARLNTIESSIGGLKERVGQHDPVLVFGSAVQDLSLRLENLERDHAALIGALRPEPVQDLPEDIAAQSLPTEPAVFALEQESEGQEALALETSQQEIQTRETAQRDSPGHGFLAAEREEIVAQTGEDEIAFAPRDHAFSPIPDVEEDDSDIAFDNVFVEAEPDDLLAQARLSAQAAVDRAESERILRLSAFHAGPEKQEGTRSRYLIPALAAALVVMFTVAALVMSQRARTLGEQLAAANPTGDKIPGLPALPTNTRTEATPQTSSDNPTNGPESDQTAEIASTPRSTAQATRATGAAAETTKTSAPKTVASATGDRVVQLAGAGNPVALAILGIRALDGTGGTAVNLPDAVKFLTLAADKSQAVAQYRLGTLYERGQGVAADPVKAMHWYGLAAAQGNRKAMHNLAVAYASGPAAKRNMTEAARWFAKAAALGLADSQFNLAVLYERGEGVPQSLADAYKWYAVAAQTGDGEAKARMGVLETQLSDSDRASAGKSAASFHASPLIRSVNVPPEPADLGT